MKNTLYFLDGERLPKDITEGIRQLVDSNEYPLSIGKGSISSVYNAEEIFFQPDTELLKGGFSVWKTAEKINISYGRKIDSFRALGCALGQKSDFTQVSHFDMVGVMLDCSRNGVMTPDNVKAFLRRCALMGINIVMLYTEDTYEIQRQPFWGYLRGRYTQNELREFDNYAYNLGIEMFPCIQTLGHLEQVLQWELAYKEVTDTRDILLVGEGKTYKLLEQIISAASAPFRSKRIHLGMDEAHALGTGEYKKRHGERRTFDIMNEHLARVCDICNNFGLKPMIWSDMYFRMGSKTNNYYDLNTNIPQDVIDNIPKNLELVYWDYYHVDCEFYAKFIDLHRCLGKEPIVAVGAWNWNRFWSALPFAYSTIEPCIQVCKDKNVRQIFITTWGDDGMENDIYSALPALQFFAEMAYSDKDKIDEGLLRVHFQGSCQTDIDAYNLASKLDSPPCLKNPKHSNINISKWLLWDDPLIGLCEPLQEGQSFREHYTNLARDLEELINRGNNAGIQRLYFPAQLAKVLAIKCDCRKNLVKAYKKQNKKKLTVLLEQEVRPLLKEVKHLWRIHRDMWLTTYKPFGLEVIEIRYGGLMARLESLIIRLEQYLEGKIKNIPEFETKLLKFQEGSAKKLHHVSHYRRIATPSAIF